MKKSGAWYTYEGEQLGQGRENAKGFLIDNAEVMVDIAEKVRAAAGIGVERRARRRRATEVDLLDPDDLPITLD